MNALIVLLFALLLFGFTAFESTESSSEEQACAVTVDGIERCGPVLIDGHYQLPGRGMVIWAIVNNGPLPPEYQAGYEIAIDAAGVATVTVVNEGQAENPETMTIELGEPRLQALLGELDTRGCFHLPRRSEFADTDLPVGGSVSILEVTLADGAWASSAVTLSGADLVALSACQDLLAEALGVTSPLE